MTLTALSLCPFFRWWLFSPFFLIKATFQRIIGISKGLFYLLLIEVRVFWVWFVLLHFCELFVGTERGREDLKWKCLRTNTGNYCQIDLKKYYQQFSSSFLCSFLYIYYSYSEKWKGRFSFTSLSPSNTLLGNNN